MRKNRGVYWKNLVLMFQKKSLTRGESIYKTLAGLGFRKNLVCAKGGIFY